jgi:hypothetical protein
MEWKPSSEPLCEKLLKLKKKWQRPTSNHGTTRRIRRRSSRIYNSR